MTENLDVHSLQLAMILRGWLPVTVECPSVCGSPSDRLREMQENKTKLVEQLAERMLKQVKGALSAVGARKSQQHLSMELGIVIRTNMAINSPGHYRVGVLADTYHYLEGKLPSQATRRTFDECDAAAPTASAAAAPTASAAAAPAEKRQKTGGKRSHS